MFEVRLASKAAVAILLSHVIVTTFNTIHFQGHIDLYLTCLLYEVSKYRYSGFIDEILKDLGTLNSQILIYYYFYTE